MTLTLIICIYIDLPNFVNVTMYCYRHVTYVLLLHVFMHVYNVPKPNRCPSIEVLTHTHEARADLTARARVGHTCGLYHVTQAVPALLRYTETILYPLSVYCILYTVFRLYYLIVLHYMKRN